MKYLVSILLLVLVLPFSGNAFLWEKNSNSLYKDLHQWFEDLDIRNYEYALGGENGDIQEKLNDYLEIYTKNRCIWSPISSSQLNSIVAGNIFLLSAHISDECKTNDGSIPTAQLTEILRHTQTFAANAQIDAQKLSDQLYNISRVGIFADGQKENSWFDLILDLQEIDAIIFSEAIDYAGESNLTPTTAASAYNGLNLAGPQRWIGRVGVIHDGTLYTPPPRTSTPEYATGSSENILDIFTEGEYTPEFAYVCTPDSSSNGLTPTQSAALLADIEAELTPLSIPDISKEDIFWTEALTNQLAELPKNNNVSDASFPPYESVADEWPCSGFFCIEVDFISYNHNLLWWWDDTSSIEYLVARSNKHLKPFVYSSLTPAKVTTNNFELSLENLNLGDNFSLPFILQYKPVPILRKVKKEDETDEDHHKGRFAAKNLMARYYETLWLEYEKKNDISQYLWSDFGLATIYRSSELPISEFSQKYSEYLSIKEKQKEKFEHISSSVVEHAGQNDLEDFRDQFQETHIFLGGAITNYVERLDILIRALNKIPTQW